MLRCLLILFCRYKVSLTAFEEAEQINGFVEPQAEWTGAMCSIHMSVHIPVYAVLRQGG